MPERHIARKKSIPPDPDDKFSSTTTQISENDENQIEDVQNRAITFRKKLGLVSKENEYKVKSEDVRDGFGNTAQYLKFINAHLAQRQAKIDKLREEKEKFEKEIALLKPTSERTKSDLEKINYKEITVEDVRKVLLFMEEERRIIEEKIKHFSSQINQAKQDLEEKDKKMIQIQNDLNQINNKEPQIVEIKKEEDAIEIIQKELTAISSRSETEKIFGAINSLVVLLNSKNQATLNELSAIKEEFNKMKLDYEKVMNSLKKKNQ